MLLSRFFFQAEDGIRDLSVTGVQTCALPIFHADPMVESIEPASPGNGVAHGIRVVRHPMALPPVRRQDRSEERRVGKEGGARLRTLEVLKIDVSGVPM